MKACLSVHSLFFPLRVVKYRRIEAVRQWLKTLTALPGTLYSSVLARSQIEGIKSQQRFSRWILSS